jgi:hypothetical protein
MFLGFPILCLTIMGINSMIITIVFVCLMGWVVGVWVPWWVVASMWCGYGVKLCMSKQSGLDNAIGDFLWGILLVIASVSGFIFGDVTFVDIGDWLFTVFTGGKA